MFIQEDVPAPKLRTQLRIPDGMRMRDAADKIIRMTNGNRDHCVAIPSHPGDCSFPINDTITLTWRARERTIQFTSTGAQLDTLFSVFIENFCEENEGAFMR